jgi:hypothetical protein
MGAQSNVETDDFLAEVREQLDTLSIDNPIIIIKTLTTTNQVDYCELLILVHVPGSSPKVIAVDSKSKEHLMKR